MKYFIAVLLLVLGVWVTYAYATATRESNDDRAKPVSCYGKTSGGTLVSILVDSNGIIQTT